MALVAEVERLKRYDEDFRRYAQTDLGLRDCPPERRREAPLRSETVERWRELAMALEQAPPPPKSRVRVVAEFGQQMLSWSTPLMAREPDQEGK